MDNLAVAAEITAHGALAVLSIMGLISLSIWLTGRFFVYAENRKERRTERARPARLNEQIPASDVA